MLVLARSVSQNKIVVFLGGFFYTHIYIYIYALMLISFSFLDSTRVALHDSEFKMFLNHFILSLCPASQFILSLKQACFCFWCGAPCQEKVCTLGGRVFVLTARPLLLLMSYRIKKWSIESRGLSFAECHYLDTWTVFNMRIHHPGKSKLHIIKKYFL